MKVKTFYITDKPSLFVPASVFESKGDETIWMTVSNADKPPIKLVGRADNAFHPGLDGTYIELEIGDEIEIVIGDVLDIKGYRLYVSELAPVV